MKQKLDWKDLKAAFLNLSDEEWKYLVQYDYDDFIEAVLDLESEDYFGTEGMNKRFA
jgi:hypothetical protein